MKHINYFRGSFGMRILHLITTGIVLLMLETAPLAAKTGKLEGTTARTSYSLGYQMGQDLKRQGVSLNRPAVIRGLQDGQADTEPLMSKEEIGAVLSELKQRIVADMARKRTAESAALKQAGSDYLETNGSKPGVKTTASGLQYKVIREGSGKQPGPTDTVRVHYRGGTVEGQEFDSTYKRGAPREFAVNRVIRGWSEGLQLMKEGAMYELYIPWKLAYGSRGPLAFQALIFEVELLAVNPKNSNQTRAGGNRN
jgi:FKBP-type peptidyl-prolyl cis-trans isomerase FklB